MLHTCTTLYFTCSLPGPRGLRSAEHLLKMQCDNHTNHHSLQWCDWSRRRLSATITPMSPFLQLCNHPLPSASLRKQYIIYVGCSSSLAEVQGSPLYNTNVGDFRTGYVFWHSGVSVDYQLWNDLSTKNFRLSIIPSPVSKLLIFF